MTRLLVVNHAVELGGAERTLLELLARRPRPVEATLAVPAEGPLSERARSLGVAVEIAGPGAGALAFRRTDAFASPLQILRAGAGLGVGLARLVALARGHDLVLTNSTKAHLYGSIAARLAGRRCVWRLHDVIDPAGFAPRVRQLYSLAARLADRIVTVSEAAAEPLRAAGIRGVVSRPNGVRLRLPANPDEVRRRIRAELGVPSDAPLCVFVGRLTAQKGPEVLLAALERLPLAHAAFVGEPLFSEEPGYAEKLHRLAAPLGGRAIFPGHRDDVADILTAADLLVHPAVRPDSLPTVILEALSAGTPVVATTAGGAAEILEEGGGLLVPPDDPDALAAAMASILEAPEKREALAVEARLRARHYAPDAAYGAVWRALLD